MRKLIQVCLLPLILLVIVYGCRKNPPHGSMPEGQIAVTFDDWYIDNWYSYLPLLDSLGIKATFYIGRYHELSDKQKVLLRNIADRGHEIAFHTSTHPDMVKALEKRGMSYLINKEIRQDLALMKNDGYPVENFAYPFGSHNPELDVALLREFKSIRAVSNKQNWNRCLAKKQAEKQIFYGAGIDGDSKMTDREIISIIENAYKYHDCVVFAAHLIGDPSLTRHVSPERLKLIASEARKRNMPFVTISQLIK